LNGSGRWTWIKKEKLITCIGRIQWMGDKIVLSFFLNHDYTEEDEEDDFKVFFSSSSSSSV
jgi:hypothetical protein